MCVCVCARTRVCVCEVCLCACDVCLCRPARTTTHLPNPGYSAAFCRWNTWSRQLTVSITCSVTIYTCPTGQYCCIYLPIIFPSLISPSPPPPLLCAVSLHKHLKTFQIEYLQFAFRWVNNLLMRELPLRLVVRLWDTYLVSTSPSPLHQCLLCQFFHLTSSTAVRRGWVP